MNFSMPTPRRPHADPSAGRQTPLRSSLADAAWAVEDRVVWGAADLLRGLLETVKWPFERIAWATENWLVWPIQEETALWSRPVRAGALAMTMALAAAGVAAGIVVSHPSSGGGRTAQAPEPAGAPAAAATAAAAKDAAAPGPVLHGAAPTFAPESGGGVPKSELDTVPATGTVAADADAAAGAKAAPTASAASGSDGPEVAGPAAIKVAREFAGAFVLYETGHDNAEVRATFARTATPDLAQALLKRPPRLPASVDVPQARVLNIVSGPKHGDTYTLSVSLLRVGLTSELRIDMQKGPGPSGGPGTSGEEEKAHWVVTDVLG